MVHCACNRLYSACNRLYSACNHLFSACDRPGGWPFYRAGLRAQRATLPKLWWWRARPNALVFLHLNDSFLRESPFEVNAHAHHITLVARTWRARWFPKAVLSPCNKAALGTQKHSFDKPKGLLWKRKSAALTS